MICKLILCKIYSLRIKKSKMSNQNYYIPFGGIGEIEFNVKQKTGINAMQCTLIVIKQFLF